MSIPQLEFLKWRHFLHLDSNNVKTNRSTPYIVKKIRYLNQSTKGTLTHIQEKSTPVPTVRRVSLHLLDLTFIRKCTQERSFTPVLAVGRLSLLQKNVLFIREGTKGRSLTPVLTVGRVFLIF
ncbi:hypothetical protein UPYG_G00159790 [Umbra pygmaea]|uniref:Uncharacterized protein n=1 Tax=Umbra pygmaea TaxID=75934 RepID=A0ABD0X075_UMBPY